MRTRTLRALRAAFGRTRTTRYGRQPTTGWKQMAPTGSAIHVTDTEGNIASYSARSHRLNHFHQGIQLTLQVAMKIGQTENTRCGRQPRTSNGDPVNIRLLALSTLRTQLCHEERIHLRHRPPDHPHTTASNPGELQHPIPGELTLHLAIPLPHSHVSAHCGGAGNQILLSLGFPGPRGPEHRNRTQRTIAVHF